MHTLLPLDIIPALIVIESDFNVSFPPAVRYVEVGCGWIVAVQV